MFSTSLSDKITSHSEFWSDYESLLTYGISRKLGPDNRAKFQAPNEEKLSRLIKSASILCLSERPKHHDIAYQIASSLITYDKDSLSRPIFHIFEKLGNFPAIMFAFKEEKPLTGSDLRSASISIAHEDSNQVTVGNKKVTLTNFQKNLWGSLTNGNSVAVSAPTSAGKTFVIMNYLARQSGLKTIHACFIVPSRALITQVSQNLAELTTSHFPDKKIKVTSIPRYDHRLAEKIDSFIYVLTQERLHILLDETPSLRFDLTIVDEAQQLSSGGRGVLLYSGIERISETNPNVQEVYICPYANIESSIPKIFPRENLDIIKEDSGSVAQHIINIKNSENSKSALSATLIENDRETAIGTFQSEIEVFDDNHAAVLAVKFGSGSSNLIYAGGPARCETIGIHISQLLSDDEKSKNQEARLELSSFIEKAIHPNFPLAELVKSGIGIHYGRLPSLVRKEIEKAFTTNTIDYIVSTSTLLYGVNLPARNLFIDKPIKGKNDKIDDYLTGPEFWNLAGRAGRLGKEFEGNIFLYNLEQWKVNLTKAKKDYEVESSFRRQILQHTSELSDFIRDFDIASGDDSEIENASVKAFIDYASGGISNVLKHFDERLDKTSMKRLESALKKAHEQASITVEAAKRSPTVSIAAQSRLKNYFVKRINTHGPMRVIPEHPLRESAYESYKWVFRRIHTYFECLPGKNNSHFYYASLARKWMQGLPLPRLIDDQIKRQKKEKGKINYASLIRKLLQTIDHDLRFRYVKYLSCYNHVLSDALIQTGNEEYLGSIPNLTLYMEMGASSPTMISLMEIGVSRITAAETVRYIANKNMDMDQITSWITKTNIGLLDLPLASKEELNTMKILVSD